MKPRDILLLYFSAFWHFEKIQDIFISSNKKTYLKNKTSYKLFRIFSNKLNTSFRKFKSFICFGFSLDSSIRWPINRMVVLCENVIFMKYNFTHFWWSLSVFIGFHIANRRQRFWTSSLQLKCGRNRETFRDSNSALKTTEWSVFIKSDTPELVADLSANYTDEWFSSRESSTDYEIFRISVAVNRKISSECRVEWTHSRMNFFHNVGHTK